MNDLAKDLKALGSGTVYSYDKPNKDLLECFPNPSHRLRDDDSFMVQITAPEFTNLCPKTGQPDFAEIYIEYTPRDRCVESKSLKLYLGSFRMFGEFHEACVVRIMNDLVALLDPTYMLVEGRFSPRGGIKFWPKARYYK